MTSAEHSDWVTKVIYCKIRDKIRDPICDVAQHDKIYLSASFEPIRLLKQQLRRMGRPE